MGVVQHAGHVLNVTGQVAWDEREEIVGLGDIAAQSRQCYRNINADLAGAGGHLGDFVAVTTYFVMVAGLGHPNYLVKLAPIAVVPDERFFDPTSR